MTFRTKYRSRSGINRAQSLNVRVILKLDKAYTEYSAQYLVENACPKKEARQGETDLDDHVGEEGIYGGGPSCDGTRYVGLRDVMIDTIDKVGEVPFESVQLYYNKDIVDKMAFDTLFLGALPDGSQVIKPGPLHVDFFLPLIYQLRQIFDLGNY